MSELATPTHLLTLTEPEIEQIRADMESGLLPPNYADIVADARAKFVFGHDAKRRRDGSYEEAGYGSPSNMTENSINSYIKYCSHEPDHERHLSRMKAQLAECNARRAAAAKPQF